MPTANPLRNISLLINNVLQGSTGSVSPRDEISKARLTSQVGIKELMGSIVDGVQGKRNYEIPDVGHYT
jgi:hypothetical protein